MTTTTMPNNILIGSEKLFRTKAPWRIEGSLLGQITNDHEVILFNHDSMVTTYERQAKKIGTVLYRKLQREHNKIIFVGFEDECRIAAELGWLGFNIDAAVFVNNTHNPSIYNHIYDHTAIYNFYTDKRHSELKIEGAEFNQYVKTYLPAHMSNRLAKEIAGCLIFQTYEMTYLNKIPATFTTVKQ